MSHNEDQAISSPYLPETKILPGIEPQVEEHALEDWTMPSLYDSRFPYEEDEEPDPNYGDPRTFLFKKGDRCALHNLQDEDNQQFNGMVVAIDIQRQCQKTTNNPSGHAYYLAHNPMSGHFVYEERLRLV